MQVSREVGLITTFYVWGSIVSGIGLLWVTVRVWRSIAPVRYGVALLLGLTTFRIISEALSVLLPLSPPKLFLAHLAYIGERLLVYAWLAFVAQYTEFMHGRWRRLVKQAFAVVMGGVAVLFGALITFAPTLLTFSLKQQDGYWIYLPSLAPPWGALLGFFESLLFLSGVLWLVRFIWHRRRRIRDVLMTFLLLTFPWLTFQLWRLDVLQTGAIRPTAFASIIAIAGLALYLNRTALWQAQYISLHHVSQHLSDAIIVVDDNGRIQAHNTAARPFLGVPDAVGDLLAERAPQLAQLWREPLANGQQRLSFAGRMYDVRIVRLGHWLVPLWLLTLEDITPHVLVHRRLETTAHLLALLAEDVPQKVFYAAVVQKVRYAIGLEEAVCLMLEYDEEAERVVLQSVDVDDGTLERWQHIFESPEETSFSFWRRVLELGKPFPIADMALVEEPWARAVQALGFSHAWLVPVRDCRIILVIVARESLMTSRDVQFVQEVGDIVRIMLQQRDVHQALERSREIAALAGQAGATFLRQPAGRWEEAVRSLLTHIQQKAGFASIYLLSFESAAPPTVRLVARASHIIFPNSEASSAPLSAYGLSEDDVERLKAGHPSMFVRGTAPPDAEVFLARKGGQLVYIVPVFVHGQLWGGLGVLERRTRTLLPEETYALHTTAALVGAAIERSEEEEARRTRMRTLQLLNSITLDTLRAPTFDEMLDRLAETVGVLFEADGAFVTLWDAEQQMPVPGAAYGPYKESYRSVRAMPGEPTITEAVLEAGTPIVIEDVLHSPLVSERLVRMFPTKTVLALPLMAEGERVGALLISYHRRQHVSEEYVALGEQVAGQVALAIKHHRLQNELAVRLKETELLREAAAMLTASLDFETTVQRILESLQTFVPYHSATVQLLKHEHGHTFFEIVGGQGWADDALVRGIRFLVPGPNPNTLVWRRKQPVRIDDVLSAGYFLPTFESQAIRSWMGVPLLFEGQLMGMITLDYKEVGFFTQEHERLVSLFAQHAAIALHNAQLHDTQQKRTRELEALHRATRLLLHSLDVQRVAETFLDICLEAVPTAEKGALMVLDESEGILRMLVCRGYRDERVRTLTLPLDAPSYAAKAVRERRGFVVEDVWADYRIRYRGHIREVGEIRSAVVVPLMSRDEILGVFALDATYPHAFTEEDLRLLETFAATAGLVIHNAQLHQQIEHTSRIDPLTGLYNRRGFFYLADHLLGRTDRMLDDTAVLLFDIDHFKQVNDTFGHDVGDEVLRELAHRAQTLLRERDVVARYGGEEFVILLTNVSPEIAMTVAERLRHRIGHVPFKTSAGRLPITVSIGVAMKPAHGGPVSLAQLITWADKALYAAKNAGRNCTFMANARADEELHLEKVIVDSPF